VVPATGKVDGSCGVQSNNYWTRPERSSGTTNANNTSNAWNVNLNDGNVNNDDKTNTNYVWPVRGGE
jgi:RNA-directed DNA polymerase